MIKTKFAATKVSAIIAISPAFAVNGPFQFSWPESDIPGPIPVFAMVPGAVLAPGETLAGINVSYNGSFRATAVVTPFSNVTATLVAQGQIALSFGGTKVDANDFQLNSSPLVIAGGTTEYLESSSLPLGPGALLVDNLGSFVGGNISINHIISASLGVMSDPASTIYFEADGMLHSSANGVVTYIISKTLPPHIVTSPPALCDAIVPAIVGQEITFQVEASDPEISDQVILNATELPTGATTEPSLPVVGNPMSVTFRWTPISADIGIHSINFVATDLAGLQTSCQLTFNVSPKQVQGGVTIITHGFSPHLPSFG